MFARLAESLLDEAVHRSGHPAQVVIEVERVLYGEGAGPPVLFSFPERLIATDAHDRLVAVEPAGVEMEESESNTSQAESLH